MDGLQHNTTVDHTVQDFVQPLPVHGPGKSKTATGCSSDLVPDDFSKAARTEDWLKQIDGLEQPGTDVLHEDSVYHSASERGNRKAKLRLPAPLGSDPAFKTWLRYDKETPVVQDKHASPDTRDHGHDTALTAIELKDRAISRLKWLKRHTGGESYYHAHSGGTLRKSRRQEYTQPLSLSFTEPAQPRLIPPSPLSPEREHTPPDTYLKEDN